MWGRGCSRREQEQLTHSETTNLSGEQATMDQVQGSTELMSHSAMTPFSSRSRLFTAISAATAAQAKTAQHQQPRDRPVPRRPKQATEP